MRNLIIICFLIIATVSWKVGHLGYSLYAQKQQWQTQGTNLAKQYTAITTVDQVFVYNGKESFLVVEGNTAQNIPIIAWFKDNQFVSYEYRKDLKSEEFIQNRLKKDAAGAQNIVLTPGMENKTPLWEARFTDQEGKLNYLYYNMKTGDVIRSFRLQKVDE